MRIILSALALLSGMMFYGHTTAATLPEPAEKVVLTVSGNIAGSNSDEGVEFDLKMIEALPQHQFETRTPWTEGTSRYHGVLLSVLLDYVGAAGHTMTATALNDYKVSVNYQELKDYPIMLAYKKDGQYMRIRDKGPLWILYPMSDFKELDHPRHHSGMVWQLRKLQID